MITPFTAHITEATMPIRKYQKSDFSEILKIYALTKLEELRFESRDFKLVPLDRDTIRLQKFEECEVFVYEEAAILGYCAMHHHEIRALFVLPAFQGRGIGKSMLGFLLSRILGTASLSLAASNTPAKKIYESFGFTVSSEFMAEYDGKPVLAIEMQREQSKE
nr:N-acetyltransferase [uncultured Albidiferax sp.]